MMRTYDLLEDDIIAKLSTLNAEGIDVEVLPDRESKYKKPTKPRITVAYISSEFSPEVVRGIPQTRSTNEGVLTEFATVKVFFRARVLRGAKGLHNIAIRARKLIFGFKPSNWNRLLIKSYQYQEYEDGIWLYSLTMVCTALVVQDQPDEPTDGLPQFAEGTVNVTC